MTDHASRFSAREVAAELGVNERTVRRWIMAGEVPATKQGKTFRISMDDARERFRSSRAARASEQAEWRGRYLEVSERLARVEAELEAERQKSQRLESVLYMPPEWGLCRCKWGASGAHSEDCVNA